MKKSVKQFFSFVLTVALVLTLMPSAAFAADGAWADTDTATGPWQTAGEAGPAAPAPVTGMNGVVGIGVPAGQPSATDVADGAILLGDGPAFPGGGALLGDGQAISGGGALLGSTAPTGGAIGSGNPFEDVDPGDWFFEDINFIFNNGLMNGIGTDSQQFGPGMPMSRAMLVTVLYRLAGSPDTDRMPNAFTDVAADAWYANAAAWAAENGVIEGMGGGRFAPDVSITREQAATILLRYARLIGKAPAGELTGGIDFADKDKIADWALEGVMWCAMNGIFTGKLGENGMRFDPQGNATRAELAAMLHRLVENVTGSVPPPATPTPGAISNSGSGSGDSDSARVSFNTNGGSAISPLYVPKGQKLMNVPVPVKDDSVFTGWYTDSGLTQPFYSDDPVMRNTTLHASYEDRDYQYNPYVNSVKFVDGCATDAAFEILSSEPIDDSNLYEYITIENQTDLEEVIELDVVESSEDVYTISPEDPYSYTPGDTYELTLIDDDATFHNEDEQVRTIAFSIVKEETFDVEIKDNIKYILWSEVRTLDDGVYSVSADTADALNITSGATICMTDEIDGEGKGVINENSVIRKVTAVIDMAGTDPARVILFTESATLQDVYESLDIYLKQTIDPNYLAQNFDTEKLARNVKNSEGARRLTNLLAVALNESRTVAEMAQGAGSSLSAYGPDQRLTLLGSSSGSSGFTDPVEYGDFISLSTQALLDGLEVTASIGTASNTNFHNSADDNTWIVLSLTFAYDGTINNTIQVKANFTFKEYFTFEQGTQTTYRTTDSGKTKDVLDLYLDAYSHTKVHFDILVRTVAIDGYFNITEEIEGLIEDLSKEDNGNVPEILQEVLGKKGDYIDIVVVDLYEHEWPIVESTPVFQVNLDVDFVIRLNMAVGLSTDYNLLSASRIGLRVDKDLGHTETYSYELDGSGKQAFDLYAAGYIGIKAGIRADLSLSFYKLEDMASVGLTGEVGAYIDLYGFLQMHMTVANKDAEPDININGGLYMEVGLYVELSIYAKSDWFKTKAEYTILDKKFPFFSLGDQYVFLGFKNAGKNVLINTNEYGLRGSGMMDCEMLDLKTGQVVAQDFSQSNDFYFTSSNPRIKFEYKDKFAPKFLGWGVTASNKANCLVAYPNVVTHDLTRMDSKISVYYGGDQLCFSSQKADYVSGEIDLIWIHPSIDPATLPTLNPVTATYVVNMDGVETTVQTKTVLAGYSPGAFAQYEDYTMYARPTGFVNDWNAPIRDNTTYKVNMTKKQMLVDYIYMHDGQWHYEVYAVSAGETPPLPANYQNPGPGNTFAAWQRMDYRYLDSPYNTTSNYELSPSDFLSADYKGLTYTGLSKSGALYSFSGTKDACFAQFNQQQKTMPVVFHNVAQYNVKYILIEFEYPRMEYTMYGKDYHIAWDDDRYRFAYGDIPLPPNDKALTRYPGCVILGWSTDNNDMDAEREYSDLPPATVEISYPKSYTLVPEYKEARIIFKTDRGTFADGTSTTVDSGMLAYPDYLAFVENFQKNNNAATIPQTVDDGVVYRFVDWEVDYSQDRQHIQTWNAVWQVVSGQQFTVSFDAGGGQFAGGGASLSYQHSYGTTFSLSGFDPVKAADNYNAYTLSGWRDTDGNTYGLTDAFTVRKNTTLTAQYTPTPITYTITVIANPGKFSDDSSEKTFTGTYNQDTDFAVLATLGNPTRPDDSQHSYTFSGWSPELPAKFTSDMTIYAVYSQVDQEYTITFDANGGYFDGVPAKTTITQTCTYGAVIVPPVDPTRPDTTYFEYEFDGWNPALNPSESITGDRTYTAIWLSTPTGALPASEITVSDGEKTEYISEGTITGYTYGIDELMEIPTLRITGNGLTLSGTGNGVYIIIADTVGSVTFSDLSLSVASAGCEGLVIDGGVDPLTIYIEDDCSAENTVGASPTLYINNREVQFVGVDGNASLQISDSGGAAVYTMGDLTFMNLNLTVNAEAAEGVLLSDRAAIGGEIAPYEESGSADYLLSFIDSDVSITSDFWGINAPEVVVDHCNLTIEVTLSGEDPAPAAISATYGIALTGCSASGGTYQQLTDSEENPLFWTFVDDEGNLVLQVVITVSGSGGGGE